MEEFNAIQQRLGLSDMELAEQLETTRQAVWRYRNGKRKIPASIMKLMRLLLAQ